MALLGAKPTKRDDLRLAELMATRLCHDLSGATLAVMCAVEGAASDGGAVSDAAEILLKRLRFFRAAWGESVEAVAVADLRAWVRALPRGGKIRIETGGIGPDQLVAPAAARVLLNVLLLAVESLPSGGAITLVGDVQAGLIVRIGGPRAGWPAGLGGMLADPELALAALAVAESEQPRSFTAALTVLLAAASAVPITMLMSARTEDAPPLALDLANAA